MQEFLQARDRCEEHVLTAIDALAVALGIGAAPTADSAARRAEQLTIAARAVAAAQAANDSTTPAAPAD